MLTIETQTSDEGPERHVVKFPLDTIDQTLAELGGRKIVSLVGANLEEEFRAYKQNHSLEGGTYFPTLGTVEINPFFISRSVFLPACQIALACSSRATMACHNV